MYNYVRSTNLARGRKSIINKMINHKVSGKELEDLVHTVLTRCRFHTSREVEMSSGKFEQKHHKRNIDIKFTYGKMERYLEVDGKIHGSLEMPTETTLKRNADFERVKLNYILINHESITFLRKIMQEEGKISGVKESELIEFLVSYRAWEEYSKHLAKLEAGEMFV
jgi:hypothetical protein